MKIRLFTAGVCLLLAACGPPRPATEAAAPPAPHPAAPAAAAGPAVPAPVPRFSAAGMYGPDLTDQSDTVLRWQHQRYQVAWRVRLDTLQPLVHHTPPNPATGFAGDTTTGYQGTYQLEVRDSLRHLVGRHTFTKADFYPAVGPELAIISNIGLPRLLGYSEPLGGLVYTLAFGAPGTDWVGEAVLVLAPTGQLRYLASGSGDGGPDVETTLSPDGRTLLSAGYLWHAGQPRRPLARPGAELRGAMLLGDTLALALYEPGRVVQRPREFPKLVATAAQRRQPNAFLLDVRTGRIVSRFRFDGFFYELGYLVPWRYVPAARTAYLLDTKRGLYVLPLLHPAALRVLPLDTLAAPAGTGRPHEVGFTLSGSAYSYQLYADTLHEGAVRGWRLEQ